ncbi:carboxypeptidase-like regulatory domain-containing protein [uncultured Rubinisphaera sp.]|uniref:carboxypeptidase-like regulatory domain-containing protein n=1 Tax=uncultured Rubinisphaera sp. TaxID=1678686 RepID=UPI0030DBAFF4
MSENSPKKTGAFLFASVLVCILLTGLIGGGYFLNQYLTRLATSTPSSVSTASSPATPTMMYFEPGQGEVTGRVLLPSGAENTDDLLIYYAVSGNEYSGEDIYQTGVFGPVQGEFSHRIRSGNVILYTEHPDYALTYAGPISNFPGLQTEEFRLELTKGRELEVELKDDKGNPISNATVSAAPVINAHQFGSFREAEKIDENVYLLKMMPATTLRIRLSAPGYSTREEDIDDYDHWSTQMQTAKPTTGKVVDADGNPVAGAKLRHLLVADESEDPTHDAILTTTAEDGTFLLDQLAEDAIYFGIVESPDMQRTLFNELKEDQKDVEIKIPKTGIITGTIRGDFSLLKTINNNQPIVGIRQELIFTEKSRRIHHHSSISSYDMPYSASIHDLVEVSTNYGIGTFEFKGTLPGKVEIQIGPYLVPIDSNGQDDWHIELDLTTGKSEVKINPEKR